MKSKNIIIAVIALAILIVVTFLAIGVIMTIKVPTERGKEYVPQENSYFAAYSRPSTSHSGKYQLQIVKGKNNSFDYVGFNIAKNVNGLFNVIEYASDFIVPQSTDYYFMWDKNDRIWCFTGKDGYVANELRGFYFCEKDKNNNWKYYSCKEKSVRPPQELVDLVESRR